MLAASYKLSRNKDIRNLHPYIILEANKINLDRLPNNSSLLSQIDLFIYCYIDRYNGRRDSKDQGRLSEVRHLIAQDDDSASNC
jgi:hypothetical protein